MSVIDRDRYTSTIESNKHDTTSTREALARNPVVKLASLGKCALRNRCRIVKPKASDSMNAPSSPRGVPKAANLERMSSHSQPGSPSSPSGRLFQRISASLKEHGDEEEKDGVHYCDIVDGSAFNQRPDCQDLDCWRHGNFSPSDPAKSMKALDDHKNSVEK